jgi:hypothetical protein
MNDEAKDKLRTIIAGSRTCNSKKEISMAIRNCGWKPSVVISGTARGADKLGELWAEHFGIPVERFPADWDKFGKSAGYKRNAEMADNAEALIALWDGKSRGTKHMIDIAKSKGLRTHVHIIPEF